MKVIYFQDPRGNFGDELNHWLWPKVFGDAISGFGHHGKETRAENDSQELLFYGIGTILDNRIPDKPEKIIFGSGFGYGDKPENLDRYTIFFVRGKKTAAALGVVPDKALTDPAILLRHFFSPVPDEEKRYDIAFMPHHSSASGGFWRQTCEKLKIHYIDPRSTDVESVVSEIAASRLMITEAMHGAIVADALRVPWIPVSSVKETNDFKWLDWCGTLGIDYEPVRMVPIFPDTKKRKWKQWINKIKQFIRTCQMASVMKSRDKARLSEKNVLDVHMAAVDRQVQMLKDYLGERGKG